MRRIARIQQRKRQTWLALPASGIEEVGHGCRTERSNGQACREAAGTGRAGIAAHSPVRHQADARRVDALDETKDRTTVWRLITHAHSLGAEKSATYFEIKRHGFEIFENVARKLRQAGFAESLQMNAEDYGEDD